MFDIGWSELLLIGVVALIVVGPRDLPGMFHALGRMTAKARGMAREFSRAMEDAARETGLNEAAGSIKDLKGIASKKSLGLDALEKATERFEKWEPKMPGAAKTAAAGAAAASSAAATSFPADPEDFFDDELADEPAPAPVPAPVKAEPAKAAPAKPAAPKAPKAAKAPAKADAAPKTAKKTTTAKAAPKTAAKSAAKPAKTPAKKGDA